MKNHIFLPAILALVVCFCACEKNYYTNGLVVTEFADDTFYEWCVDNFDTDGDGELSFREFFMVDAMDVPERYNGQLIKSLKGIENFTYLERLNCSGVSLTSLDLGGFISLTELDCSGCGLSTLNLAGCTRLESFDVSNNSLTKLDLSEFTRLTYLDCSHNQIAQLETGNNPLLKEVYCNHNLLTELEIQEHAELEILHCENNDLVSINILYCTSLRELYCHSNRISDLGFDLFDSPIEILSCYENDLSWIYVKGQSKGIKELYCQDNPDLYLLQLEGCTALETLDASGDHLTYINASDCTSLKTAILYDNIISVATFNSPVLTELNLTQNDLWTLDVSASPNINILYYNHNRNLTTVYVNDAVDIVNLLNANGETVRLGGGDPSLLQIK